MHSPDWKKVMVKNPPKKLTDEEIEKQKLKIKKSELKTMLPPTKLDLPPEERQALRTNILKSLKSNAMAIKNNNSV